MTSIKFRDYQEAAIDHLFGYFSEHKGNPIVAMPTGTGKSLVIGGFAQRALTSYPQTRIVCLTHVKELIEQNMKVLLKIWPSAPAGVYSAGLGRRDIAQITFAGIQSVYKKPAIFGRVDLIIIDECHLVSPKGQTMYREFINNLREVNPYLKVIGLSATPFRLGQGMLTDHETGLFTDVCFDLTSRDAFNWMVHQGWISPPIPKQTSAQLDVTGVKMSAGEFVLSDLQERVDRDTVTIAALREAVFHAAERKHWLIFASGIQHAEHIAGFLESNFDIPAAAVHSKMSGQDRDKRIRDFKKGRLRALVNNNILTTGFDFPRIDCIVMLRPTASPVLWVQMLGRGTRPAPDKKNCLVLDFAGNTRRLGPINDPVLPKPRGKGPPGIAPVRLCDSCGCYSHASARFCENPDCGVEFPRTVKIGTSADTRTLIAGTIQIETFKVDRVVYRTHKKEGKPDSMRVDYYCGLHRFSEYITIEHGGYATHRAKQWWQMRSPWGPPPTTADGMKAINYLNVPATINVFMKKVHPEICGYGFA